MNVFSFAIWYSMRVLSGGGLLPSVLEFSSVSHMIAPRWRSSPSCARGTDATFSLATCFVELRAPYWSTDTTTYSISTWHPERINQGRLAVKRRSIFSFEMHVKSIMRTGEALHIRIPEPLGVSCSHFLWPSTLFKAGRRTLTTSQHHPLQHPLAPYLFKCLSRAMRCSVE